MKIKTIKLGTVCLDKATDTEGTVTHWVCDMGKRIDYLIQPAGLNPEDGQPVKRIYLELERLVVPEGSFEEVDVPFEILGSHVTDKASGFNGTATSFVKFISGCFHVRIQPQGVLRKTNSRIQEAEFDLRQCKGPMIPLMTEDEVKVSKEKTPSPTGNILDGSEKLMPSSGLADL